MSRGNCRFQQVERPGHVDIHKGALRKPFDVPLMQRAGMDDSFNPALGEDAIDRGPVRRRADDVRMNTRRHIKANHAMAASEQHRRQEAAKPAGRSRKQD